MGTPSDPAALTATEALAAFRARTLSPVEVMQAVIARSERIDARIRAFSDTYFDEAMQAARRAEVRYCGTDGRPRPLEGLPLAVKDEMSELGKRITMGSLVFKDRIGTWTDAAVNRLTAAGAIAHARTVTPEFSLVGVCHSRLWGISRNPHNLAMSPGGSSGGAAAALAAGLTTLAIGSDIGGSIRIPASCCGIVGYMPPHGRVPDAPPHNLDPFSHTGPMARSVADCALMLNVMSGPHVADLATLRERVRIPAVMPGIAGWKVAYSLDFGYKTLDADVRANTLAALDVFRMLGCTVDEVPVPWTEDLPSIRRDYLYALWGSRMGDLLDNHRADLSDYTIRYAEAALGTSVAALHRAYDAITTIYEQFGRLMDRYHLFICPTTAVPAVAADHDPYASEFTIDGVSVDARSGWIMTYPFNALGRLPVMALPSGKARNGVPTGFKSSPAATTTSAASGRPTPMSKPSGVWLSQSWHEPSHSTQGWLAFPKLEGEMRLRAREVILPTIHATDAAIDNLGACELEGPDVNDMLEEAFLLGHKLLLQKDEPRLIRSRRPARAADQRDDDKNEEPDQPFRSRHNSQSDHHG